MALSLDWTAKKPSYLLSMTSWVNLTPINGASNPNLIGDFSNEVLRRIRNHKGSKVTFRSGDEVFVYAFSNNVLVAEFKAIKTADLIELRPINSSADIGIEVMPERNGVNLPIKFVPAE